MESPKGKIRYANDAVDLDDGFGTVSVGDEVAKMTLQVDTPFTLGVVGKWGSGKTSVLRRAFATLGGEAIQVEVPFHTSSRKDEHWNKWSKDWPSRQEQVLKWGEALRECSENSLCVWFSPWQHQEAANPLLPLLLEIRDQFSVRARAVEALRPAVLAGATLLERVIDGALILTGASKRPVVTGATKDAVDMWRRETADTRLDDGQRFQLLFEDAVESLLRSLEGTVEGMPKGRLIVFVDDLDRCEESAVVRLLEAIKLYLGAPNCVFVLGIDESAVLKALERHWKGRTEDDNREYLEKLFQAVIPVPVPTAANMKTWVVGQLASHGFNHPDACAEVLVDVIEPNPRKVKNFVNSLCAVWHLLGEGVSEAPDRFERRFVLLQYLRLYHKPIWRLLERDPRILRIVTQVLDREGPAPSKEEDDFDPADQKVLERFVFESFAHVLGRDPGVDEPALTAIDKEKHGHLSMVEAVELFGQRLDRKRSDQKFRMYYRQLFESDDDLPGHFLHLREMDS